MRAPPEPEKAGRGGGAGGGAAALLEGRAVLVTGAGQGIGRGICRALAEAGADVAATDLDDGAAGATAEEVRASGRRALAFRLDVTDAEAVEEAPARVAAGLGRLDGLVCNAGVVAMESALEATEEAWRRQFEVNLHALFLCCRAAAREMVSRGGGGAIVNVASNAGKVGYPRMAAYNASKAGVINLTRSLAAEWAAHGINVNAVCPGGVDTPMLRRVAEEVAARTGGDPDEALASMKPRLMDRHVQPLEVGRVVAFLLSDYAAIIRGQAINVDGGDTPY